MKLLGKLLGDIGYASQSLAQDLHQMFDVQVITKSRFNMKNQLMLLSNLFFRRREIIEIIIDKLKNNL